MSDSAPTQAMDRREPAARRVPTMAGALRGAWLFHWRSQWEWRRAAVTALCLAALPLFIYCTIPSPRSWAEQNPLFPRREGWRGPDGWNRPQGFFLRELDLDSLQEATINDIITDERNRAEKEWLAQADTDVSAERQAALLKAYRERVDARTMKLLDDQQYSIYLDIQARRGERRLERSGSIPWGRTVPFYHWLIDFYFFVILPLHCVRVCGACIRDELQADTLRFLLTRPVSRARLVLVKYLTQVAWLQLLGLAEALLLFGAGALRHVPELAQLVPLVLAAQFLAVPAWAALGLFLGLASNRAMAVAILYGLVIEMGIGRIPTNINALSIMRHLKVLLAHDSAIASLYHWSSKGTGFSIAMLLLAPILFVSAAVLLFRFKEYLHPAELQQ